MKNYSAAKRECLRRLFCQNSESVTDFCRSTGIVRSTLLYWKYKKEAQVLARHCNPNLTMNVYAKPRKENLAALVDKVASSFPTQRKFVKCLSSEENEGDGDDAISPTDNNLDGVLGWWRRRDSKPLASNSLRNTEPQHFSDKNGTIPCNSKHLQEDGISQKNKTLTLSKHKYDSSLQKKCALCVHFQNAPPDLKLVMDAWPDLPKELRFQIAKAVLETII